MTVGFLFTSRASSINRGCHAQASIVGRRTEQPAIDNKNKALLKTKGIDLFCSGLRRPQGREEGAVRF
jgi:hypothetical protein